VSRSIGIEQAARSAREIASVALKGDSGAREAIVHHLQRTLGNETVALMLTELGGQRGGPRELQRQGGPTASETKVNETVGKGVLGFSPTATLVAENGTKEVLTFQGPQSELEFPAQLDPGPSLQARLQGRVIFEVPMAWEYGSTAGEHSQGSAFVRAAVPFTISKQKDDAPQTKEAKKKQDETDDPSKVALHWQEARVVEQNSQGKGASLTGAPVQKDETDQGGSVTITPALQFQEQLALAESAQVDVTPPLPTPLTVILKLLGIDPKISLQAQKQKAINETDSLAKSFTARIKTKPSPPPPADKTEHDLFIVKPFGVDSDNVDDKHEGDITKWYLNDPDGPGNVSEAARASIEAGKTVVHVTGHASDTNNFPHNRKLAKRRAEHVQQILSDLAGSEAKFNVKSLGKAKVPEKFKKKEEETERRVEIELEASVPSATTKAASLEEDSSTSAEES
jgi:outer membrane protein OmpA-like peptidoglycan-associated protein